jgi:hypothetical protein
MVGVGIQQGFILLFLFFAVKFHRTIHAQARQSQIGMNPQLALFLLYALYAALLMITVNPTFLFSKSTAKLIFVTRRSESSSESSNIHKAY